MQRNYHGFIPPFLIHRIAERNPEKAAEYLQSLVVTAELWNVGRQPSFIIGSGQGDRKVHDAGNRTTLPGKLVRAEGAPAVADAIANSAYDFSGNVRDFYRKVFNRNSLDGNGMDMISTVHYGRRYNNAFWNGSQMTYGDGDGDIFSTFVLIDVNGHECTHGVIEYTSGLVYSKQPGALNEHAADVMGVLVSQWAKGQTADKADWLVGPGLFTPGIKPGKKSAARAHLGAALRDMLEPGTGYDDPRLGKDPQPGHMKDYVDTWQDNGGVHYNSGIPNRAFALFATALGGYAWDKAGQIWFHTFTKVPSNCQFQQFANRTVEVAKANFPDTVAALRDAWKQVGITPMV